MLLHHDLALEIKPRRETQILVRRSGVAIDATVFATAIRINARAKAHVGTLVVGNDSTRAVAEELCRRRRIFLRVPIRIALEMDLLEPVGRIGGRTTTFDGTVVHAKI